MNMVKTKPIYMSLERKPKSSEGAINICIKYPTLMQRLLNLKNDRVDLGKKSENPWYEDMEKCNITPEIVEDAEDFVSFCLEEDKKKYVVEEMIE